MRLFKLILATLLLIITGSIFGKGPPPKIVFSVEKSFYLTHEVFFGDEVLDACADGYHFANAFELLDVSNLTYNVKLGQTTADSGYGPPSGMHGWLRTGNWASSVTENCENWTSGGFDFGLVGSLNLDYPNGWSYKREQCADGSVLWCVSNPVYVE